MSKNILVASVALLMYEEKQTTKKRRTRPIWRRSRMLHRKIDCTFHTIFKELKKQDSGGFKDYVRMDVDQAIFTKARYQHERMYKSRNRFNKC